ncbi:MAG: hypothetical protein QOG82_730 [Actinomycetota bacterium]|nr:hypothetical protein [Actinomycetota bacterium]
MTADPAPGRLPSPIHDRLARLREAAARRVAGAELDRLAARITDLEGGLAQAFAQERKDLLERTDALVASYDQRVAALANRLMDLEDRLAGTSGEPSFDADAVLAAHRDPVVGPPGDTPAAERRPEADLRPYVVLLRPHQPVLDLSLGSTGLVALLEQEGIAARGIESTPGALVGTLAAIADGSLGAVCLLGVVEHLYAGEALTVLRAVAAAMAPGGRVIVETLHPGSLWSTTRTFWGQPTHARLYQPDALLRMVEGSGFTGAEVHGMAPLPVADADGSPRLGMGLGLGLIGVHSREVESMFVGPRRFAVVATRS